MGDILEVITSEFPELEAKIAWNKPMVHTHGKYIVGLAASKNHLSFLPLSAAIVEDFAARLSDYETTKKTIRIPVD